MVVYKSALYSPFSGQGACFPGFPILLQTGLSAHPITALSSAFFLLPYSWFLFQQARSLHLTVFSCCLQTCLHGWAFCQDLLLCLPLSLSASCPVAAFSPSVSKLSCRMSRGVGSLSAQLLVALQGDLRIGPGICCTYFSTDPASGCGIAVCINTTTTKPF